MKVTKQTIYYFAMKRSGSHAIMHFILRLYDQPKAFFAAQVPRRPVKPHKYWLSEDVKCIVPENFYDIEERELVLISYEDPKLNPKLEGSFYAKAGLLPNENIIIGESLKTTPILSIRDPFNMFASRYKDKHYIERRNPAKRKFFRNMWKDHAREYLGYTNVLPANTLKISFNEWFLDQEYRKSIAESLGRDFKEEGWSQVTKEGVGSSFDKRKYDNRADQMLLLERWKQVVKNKNYRSLFKDKELVDLSEKIFGHIPGTEVLYK